MLRKRPIQSLKLPKEYNSREVIIGNLAFGGDNPIRIQSMTNTRTFMVMETVNQTIKLFDAGCELVRFAVINRTEAYALEEIRNKLTGKGYDIPLAADVHFLPDVAEIAAQFVHKVRINPGNYVKSCHSQNHIYSDLDYMEELEITRERLFSLVNICKRSGTALRIGVNHGSLSPRIMSKYGDTIEGMVESAMEYIRIMAGLDFHNQVVSLKSSNAGVMIPANRLLVSKMYTEELNYPLHLGVTEAGDGEDGRIKSALGIGSLLESGIGDTIRVSLTEDPVNEVPFARKLLQDYTHEDGRLRKRLLPGISDVIRRRLIPGRDPTDIPVVMEEDHVLPDFNTVRGNSISEYVEKLSELSITEPEKYFLLIGDYDLRDPERVLIRSSVILGNLLLNGIGEAVKIQCRHMNEQDLSGLAYGILQATGARITKTEFIACPSCGRTLFNIEQTLQEVRSRTSHLKGLKIAVMGCIVNGPGEMADADYGYVGSGKGKVTLYRGKEPVIKDLDQNIAVDALVNLIKTDGLWKSPD